MVKYNRKEVSLFTDFNCRTFAYDPLTNVIASLDDFPYTAIVEYKDIVSPQFLSFFTTDGEEGRIGYPIKSMYGETKYILTKKAYPQPNYSIVCVVSTDGEITCKVNNTIGNPVCESILFALHKSKSHLIPDSKKYMAYQTYRDYDCKSMVEQLIQKKNKGELNLKNFMDFRHDIIQTMIAKMYGLNLHLGTTLDLNLYGITSNQTPDFFEILGDECLIGDVTITSDSTLGLLVKEEKYSKLMLLLEERGLKVQTLFCSFDHNFKNFDLVLGEQPIVRLDTGFDVYPILSELAVMFEELRGTYPIEASEMLEKNYPISRDKIGRNFHFIMNNLEHKDDDYFMNNYFNYEVLEAYADKKLNMEELPNTYADILRNNHQYPLSIKPSHYIPIPPDDAGFETITGKNSEQRMILNFFNNDVEDEVYNTFKSALQNCFINYPETSNNMFFNGVWIENQEQVKEQYHESRYPHSFEDYLRSKSYKIPKPTEDKIPYNKMLHLSSASSSKIQPFLDMSGQDYRKKHEVREHKEKTTCEPPVEYRNVERFMSMLSNKSTRNWAEDMFEHSGDDHKFISQIKKQYSLMAQEDIADIGETYCMKYLRYNSLIYEQLIHFSNLSMPKKRFAFFNSGIPNILGCMRCGYRGMAQQIGKPFFFMGFTKSQSFLNSNIFGKLTVLKVNEELYYFRTRWFRLPTFRIEFFRDQYYSILSSTLCSLARVRNFKTTKEMIKGTFCLRTVVGLVANQKFMERLADSRYAIMSAFATHTNFEELLVDKFSGPYKSAVEGWLVHRLFMQLPKFRDSVYESNNIRINTPILDYLDRRFQDSTGGKFNIKAIWSDRQLYSLQDLLDELFLYVHTPKEPSTAFHEEVNAIKTIQKFQKEFDKYTFEEKCGKHKSINNWLLSMPSVGFDKDFLYAAAIHYKTVVGFDLNRIEKLINRENIGELTSTKSVIPDEKRTIKPLDRHVKRRIDEVLKLKGELNEEAKRYLENHSKEVNTKVQRSTAEIYHGRHKVHDEIITYIMNYREETVLANALLFYNKTDSKVLTDICIKAQYGAKREFYVMNMGAKLMARVVEDFYKNIAKQSSTEMISVAGDRKLIHMQNMMDRTIKHALKHGNIVSYCNGDCTKWSAAETMEAFHVLTEGICAGWDSDFKFVLHAIINEWSDKQIQIPLNIISKVYPLGPKTEYVLEAAQNNYTINSTQNFLQGVFNYMSSIKADVCNRYTVHLWNKYHNHDLRFSVEYLVHSDDYVFAFSSPNLKMIEEFRSFHKVCMKLCGITDSSKKTNVQPIFMEFISLLCFNGSMAYPTIKKTKEVASTLPCESFSGDSDMVCSRTGECVRVGVDFYSSWMFHKIHMSLLRRAYSLHHGGENYFEDYLNVPVQAFGQSDMHPIFYFLCKGDPNNLRLFNFSNNGRSWVKKLYDVSNFGDTLKSVHASFKEPSFIYNNYTTRIADIRKSTGIEPAEAMQYWEDNFVYNFVKPRNIEDLERWLKCMYFKSSFIKAYNRDSRTTRMLRLSMFSKGHCVTYKTDEELQDFYFRLAQLKSKVDRNKLIASEMLTIKQLITTVKEFPDQDVDARDIQIAIMMGDSTSDLIYQWCSSASLNLTEKINIYNTCATYSPYKASWLNVSQPVDHVICYGASYPTFIKNFSDSANISAVITDFKKLSNALPGLFDTINSPETSYQTKMKSLQIAYNTYSNNLPRFQVCMSSKRHRQNTVDFLTDSFKYSHDPIFVTNVQSKIIQLEMNPFTLERHRILGTDRTTSKLRLLCNNLTIAYIYLLTQRKLSDSQASEVLANTIIDDFGITISVKDFLNGFDYDQAKMEGMTYHELIMFVFLKKAINDDNAPIRELCKNRQFYNYKYLLPQSYNSQSRMYEGDMIAHVNFDRVSAIAKIKGGRFKVITDTLNSTKAEMAYLIGLKLSSQISEREFLTLMVRPNLFKFCKNIVASSNGFYLVLEKSFATYKYIEKGQEYFGVDCKFNSQLHIPHTFDKQDNYILSMNYKLDRAAMFIDKRKMFTVPYKYAKYTKINLITDFNDFCLYNDLMAFHVLGTVPKEEHDLIELCKFWAERQKPEVEVVKDQRKISELSIDNIEIDIPMELMSPPITSDDHEQNPMVTIVDDDDFYALYDEPEEEIPQQSPFAPLFSRIELVDPATTAMPTSSNLRELEGREDVIKRTILTLLTIDKKMFLTPFEAACVIRTIGKMLSDWDNTWTHPVAHLIGHWLEKTVRITPDYEEIDGFLIRIVNDDLVYYQKRKRAASICRKFKLKTDENYFCPTDYSKYQDTEMVEYYARIHSSDFWESVGYFDPLPFYPREDDFKKLLREYSSESYTL